MHIAAALFLRQSEMREAHQRRICTDQFGMKKGLISCIDVHRHLHIWDKNAVRTVLEMMVLEYADRRADTQSVLKPMMLTLLMLISREYRQSMRKGPQSPITYKIIEYINWTVIYLLRKLSRSWDIKIAAVFTKPFGIILACRRENTKNT